MANNAFPCGMNRREAIWQMGAGFTGLALVDLLSRDGFFSRKATAAEPAMPQPKP